MTCRIWLGVACTSFLVAAVRADDWPQWLGPKRDGVWRESGIIDKFPESGPKVLWRKPVDQGYAGPAIANGKVFITDWVRGKGVKDLKSGFDMPRMAGTERVLCFDAKTGEQLWVYDYPCPYEVSYAAGPRCTPVVDGER